MDYFSDPQETVSRFGEYIDDFHDVFRCNDVDFGLPADFFTFARRLKCDSELRADVLRVVKIVMECETDISFRTILTIMAVGSGGPDVTLSEREMSVPVNLIIEALTGGDARTEISAAQSDSLYSNFSEDEMAQIPATPDGYSPGAVDAIERTELEEKRVEATASDKAGVLSVEKGPSLDERISGIELQLENVTSPALSGPTAHQNDDEGEARFYAAIAIEAKPELLQASDPPTPNQEGGGLAESLAAVPRLWTDVRQFYSSRRKIALPILTCAATLGLVGSLAWSIGRFSGFAVVHPVNASAEGVVDSAAVSTAPLTGPPAGGPLIAAVSEAQSVVATGSPVPAVDGSSADRVDGSSVVPVGAAQGSSPAPPTNVDTGQRAIRPAGRHVQPPKKPARVSFKSPPPASSPEERPLPETTADASEDLASPDRGSNLSSEPMSNRLVDVSSGVMAGNLLSSSKPSYPKLASLIRAQGNVVMQAVISKTGTVEHLHVIKGHRLLRGAAKSAVQTWRYRPYKVNGVPVEVATIVSVEFSLNR